MHEKKFFSPHFSLKSFFFVVWHFLVPVNRRGWCRSWPRCNQYILTSLAIFSLCQHFFSNIIWPQCCLHNTKNEPVSKKKKTQNKSAVWTLYYVSNIYLGNTQTTAVNTMINQWVADDMQTKITQYCDGTPKQLTQTELYTKANR